MRDTPRTDAELKRICEQLDGGEDNAAYVLSQLGAHSCVLEREVERLRETARLYEQLRSVIDGGSESMTHHDAVEAVKGCMASVPELLDALTWAMGYLPRYAPTTGALGDGYLRRYEAARQAIAKATGRQA